MTAPGQTLTLAQDQRKCYTVALFDYIHTKLNFCHHLLNPHVIPDPYHFPLIALSRANTVNGGF